VLRSITVQRHIEGPLASLLIRLPPVVGHFASSEPVVEHIEPGVA